MNNDSPEYFTTFCLSSTWVKVPVGPLRRTRADRLLGIVSFLSERSRVFPGRGRWTVNPERFGMCRWPCFSSRTRDGGFDTSDSRSDGPRVWDNGVDEKRAAVAIGV